MTTATTPWSAGRLDRRGGPRQLLFGRVYEDSAVESSAFPPGSRIFCIASAGDTAIALAAGRRVTAVDINPVQLDYARQRAAGAPMLAGAAERFMTLGRPLLRLAGWSPPLVEEFLSLEKTDLQLAFWRRHLDTRRFRWALDFTLSPRRLTFFYSEPLLAVLPPAFGAVLRRRMERCWSAFPNRSNPYARALLLGELDKTSVLAPDIRFVCDDAADFLEHCPAASFDGFALSNILDGASTDYAARLMAAVRRAGAPKSVVVRRSFAEPAEPKEDAAGRDRCFLWGSVIVAPTGAW